MSVEQNVVIRYLRRAPVYSQDEIMRSAYSQKPLPFRRGEPYGAVVAYQSRTKGIMLGWSMLNTKVGNDNKRDRWNKREAVLTALRRAQPIDNIKVPEFFAGCPEKALGKMMYLTTDMIGRAEFYYNRLNGVETKYVECDSQH